MSGSQRRAVDTYRARLSERGLARFEVIGRDTDRELLRSIARRLAEDGPEADRLRAAVEPGKSDEAGTSDEPEQQTSTKGEILRALLRSPLVGANLDLTRAREVGRKVDLG